MKSNVCRPAVVNDRRGRRTLSRCRPLVELLLCLAALLCPALLLHAETTPELRQWIVDGVTREALVYVPTASGTNPAPLVLAFHGHGGSMRNAARSFSIHTHWPEAMVVYPQGLNTPGRLTDPEGRKPGWQHAAGDQGDRDLKFVDAMLETFQREHQIDEKRVYATGHSNGGGFTYLLWAARGERFTAFAPSAAAAARSLSQLKPKPVLHVAGENDTLVKFDWQRQTVDAIRRINQCGAGQPWEDQPGCTLYPSEAGSPVVTYIHTGGHRYPAAAPALIVRFFRQHPPS